MNKLSNEDFASQLNKNRWTLIAICSLVFLIIIQLPFLRADPDIKMCCFRDAFEAEGLTASQLRNYINEGYLSLTESDKLLKLALFNLILFLPLKIFGTHLIVARLTVLIVFLSS